MKCSGIFFGQTLLLALLIGGVSMTGCTNSSHRDSAKEATVANLPNVKHLKPEGTPAALGLAGCAKVLCSAVFVSERTADQAAYESAYFLLPEDLQDAAEYSIDWEHKIAEMRLGDSLVRRAQYHGDQGCIIQRNNDPQIFFEPVDVVTALPDAEILDWPMGDRMNAVDWTGIDQQLIEKAVAAAFEPKEAMTAGLLVLHKGQIIGERYGAGAHKDMQLESWSMGKSLTAALTGRMIQLGYFKLDDPAPVEQWQAEGDPRKEIRIRDLLQMSSGLNFTSHHDPELDTYTAYLDHFYIYTGAVDAFEYSINRPLQFPVGTEGRYRNCDPLTLGLIMREKLGEAYWTFPQVELFDKIGIRRQVLETDPYGNFLLSGYDYGTVRNWGRLGQLFLQDGMWNGERLLPEGFSEFVSSHAPGWDAPVYGGLFWLNQSGEGGLPPDTYYMAGAGSQMTIIVPSLDLVIVRMGHFRGSEIGVQSLSQASELIVQAITSS